MKNFQQNLLITLALALCALCAWQWYDQSTQRHALETRNQTIFDRDGAIQSYTNTIATSDREIAALQQRLAELETTTATNQHLLTRQTHELTRLQSTETALTNDITQYQLALTNLETKLNAAYDGIQKQNTALQELVAQRDTFIAKYTNTVLQYNALVDRLNHPTNPPSK